MSDNDKAPAASSVAHASAYAAAGVDLDRKNRAFKMMGDAVRSTYGPEVLWGIGAFGGLFDAGRLLKMQQPVLVASTDGVGTKIKVATAMGSYGTLGYDIVNHCVNDILVQGAEPLFFLDYIASPTLDPQVVAAIVGGVSAACREAGCALLGGETAEMPGVYQPGELDLVGTIVGLVERGEIIDGKGIVPGDVLIGLPSSGLHTNGFSLVRRIFAPQTYDRYMDELGRPLGQALLEPHRSYLPQIRAIRRLVKIKGLAHVTGGGFVDNIPRILPERVGVTIERVAWPVPPLFQLIQREGRIETEEMYRVFNMGIGMVIIVAPHDVMDTLALLGGNAHLVGRARAWEPGTPRVAL
jgi:phosphoribosylformylglycinamidine cyclo-ligase